MKKTLLTLMMAAVIGAGGMIWAPAPAQAEHQERNYGSHSPYRGLTCRDFTRMSYQYGHLRETHGTACLHRDGNWYAVSGLNRSPYVQQRIVFASDHYRHGERNDRRWGRDNHRRNDNRYDGDHHSHDRRQR